MVAYGPIVNEFQARLHGRRRMTPFITRIYISTGGNVTADSRRSKNFHSAEHIISSSLFQL